MKKKPKNQTNIEHLFYHMFVLGLLIIGDKTHPNAIDFILYLFIY